MSEILITTDQYIVIKKGNIYVLRYFDEVQGHKLYNRLKKITQSRVTKNYNFIKKFI